MKSVQRWLDRLADDVMGLMMAVMFCTFILQIVTRYLAKYQIASDFTWTLDLCSTCMVWIVFFGGAFALAESDHVKFDMIYYLFPPSMRRFITIFTNLSIALIFAISIPAIWKWMAFLVRMGKANPTLKIPFTGGEAVPVYAIYCIYLVFAAAITARCVWRSLRLIGGAMPDDLDATGAVSPEAKAS
jgi:TRAP-type C4-dicarboxylate transport system permease small subunit